MDGLTFGLLKELDAFVVWFEALNKHDQDNFNVLVSLPNAVEIMAKLPEGEYRKQAIFVMAMRQAVQVIKEKDGVQAIQKRDG